MKKCLSDGWNERFWVLRLPQPEVTPERLDFSISVRAGPVTSKTTFNLGFWD